MCVAGSYITTSVPQVDPVRQEALRLAVEWADGALTPEAVVDAAQQFQVFLRAKAAA